MLHSKMEDILHAKVLELYNKYENDPYMAPQYNEYAFGWACENGHLHVAQWLLQIKPTINVSTDNEYAFRWACGNGHLHVAQWLLQINPTIDNEFAFQWACVYGHLHVAQWLLQIKPTINVSAYNEYAFRQACDNGHLHVAQWLLQIKPTINVSANNEYAFRWACKNGHLHIAQWLCNINAFKYGIQNNTGNINNQIYANHKETMLLYVIKGYNNILSANLITTIIKYV